MPYQSFNRDPKILIEIINSIFKPQDGCTECGYRFDDTLEGCDACKPLTDILLLLGKTHEGNTEV